MKAQKSNCVLLLFLISSFMFSQQNYWTKSSISRTKTSKKVHRATFPKTYKVYKLNIENLKNAIQNAPLRGSSSKKSTVYASFPNGKGALERYAISESPIMESELAAKFPMIKTYKAIGIDDPTATMRFSITQHGLHAMSLSGKRGPLFIDTYTANKENYIVYYKSSLGKDTQPFECLTEAGLDFKSINNNRSEFTRNADDGVLRTYRLAQTCTGEYGAIFAGSGTDAEKKANIQAQMAITMNRVNEIYERDVAITMVFINRNDELIYFDGATDPWDTEYNAKTQEVISTTLNDESLYDIGHNFNTSGGGSAGCLGCVCTDATAPFNREGFKGSGMTGRADPTGDPFDIDYVAHEMGHQFNGYHTMNTCSRSGNGTTEVEPASGSSIMGYAGICSTNVQPNSDAHFNYVNVRDMTSNVKPGQTSDCGAQTTLTNKPPTANAGDDYSIPPNTAFILKGSATDPDGLESLTYNWAPNDPAENPNTGAPQSTWTAGPLYRSLHPTSSPDRYLPKLSDVVAGNLTPTWEVTPSVARTMNFSFIVRDNGSGFANGIGQTASDLMKVTVVDAPAFTVSTPVSLNVGGSGEIIWNVGSTNNAIINCQNVNIKLSTDGGLTFPTILASNTPNDGSETVNIPGTTPEFDNSYILVEASDNIFYAISSVFPVIGNAPTFNINSLSGNQEVCNSDSDSVNYDFNFNAFNGFSETTTFSVTGIPIGATATFSPPTLNNSGALTMTLSGLSSVTAGTSTLTVTGTSTSVTKSIGNIDLVVFEDICSATGNTEYQTSTTGVTFNTISNLNNGKPSGYSDYSAQITDITKGEDYAMTINVNTDGDYTSETKVWIDWNQNCILETSEEYNLGNAKNVTNNPTSNSPLSITVPSNATIGNAPMRVTTKYNSASTACENSFDGEVEDYTVNVLEPLSVNELDNLSSQLVVFPNPNKGKFNVSLNQSTGNNINISVYDVRGRLVYNKQYKNSFNFNEIINLKTIQSGLYLLKVFTENGQANKKILIE